MNGTATIESTTITNFATGIAVAKDASVKMAKNMFTITDIANAVVFEDGSLKAAATIDATLIGKKVSETDPTKAESITGKLNLDNCEGSVEMYYKLQIWENEKKLQYHPTATCQISTLKDGISSGAFASIGYIIGTAAAEVRASGVHKNILIRYSGSGLIANVDETALNRVMTNLLVNASQSMDAGVIHVNLRTHDGMFRIEVIDNGKGIKDKHIGKLFRHGFTRDKKGGTGVGLAYCKDVIENYGGRISVHSKSDTGSIFAINLPKEKSMPTFVDDDSLDF